MTILLFKVQKLKKKIMWLRLKIEKDVFSFCHERGTKKKNSESPWGTEPQTFGFRAQML